MKSRCGPGLIFAGASVSGRSGASIVTSVSIDMGDLQVPVGRDGVEDLRVAGAAAQVAGQRRAELLATRGRVAIQVPLRGQQHPRRAEPALRARVLEEAPLQRV